MKSTTYAIDKVRCTRGRVDSQEYLVRWRGYGPEFDSRIKASSVKQTSYRNHFYVTLFSNESQKLYLANTLAAFTARLKQPIDLGSNDTWEVGVCEFTCHPMNVERSMV